jgi:hypothetical protein
MSAKIPTPGVAVQCYYYAWATRKASKGNLSVFAKEYTMLGSALNSK